MSIASIAAAILSALVLLASVALFVDVARGWRRIGQLRDLADTLPVDASGRPPKVTLLFSALNEEAHIEAAARSMLAIDYPDLEVVAIDDRSTDGTGAILDRLAAEFPRLRVLHVTELPTGWLGKCHALHRGTELASGAYLLFTDADVVFEPSALRRAIAHCERERLDQLAVYAEFVVRGPLLAMLMASQRGGFMAQAKPWLVRTSPDCSVGQGTFNLVRAAAFREAGGFEALRLAVFEDLMVGVILKKKGFQADVLFGDGMLRVEWYPSAWAMVRGLEKNTFAAFDYSLVGLTIASLMMFAMRVWPWLGLVVTTPLGVAWWLCLATALVETAFYVDLLRATRWTLAGLVFLPVISALSIAMWWRASLKAVARGGIEWRGTLYPLDQLRKGA